VQRYLPDDQKNLWPAPPDGVLAHHTPVFNTMQDMDRLLQYAGYFSACGTMRRFVVASQIAQAVAVRHTLERARCRWPHSAGALMYKLNDNFPGASWSTIDWYGAAKLSHWFVQDAFAPLHGCLLFDSVNHRGKAMSLPVFLLDDADALDGSAWKVEVRAYNSQLRLIQAEEYSGSGSIQRVSQLGDFVLAERQTDTAPLLLFMIDVRRDGELVDRTFYFVNYEDPRDCLFELPTTTLSLRIDGSDAILTNTGTLPGIGATLRRAGHLDTFSASDNCIWLEPGESHRIHVSHVESLSVDAWNLKSRSW
jgi:beta-mannosidase